MSDEYGDEPRIYDPARDRYAHPSETGPRPFEATDGVKVVAFPSMGAFRELVHMVKQLQSDVADLKESLIELEMELFEDGDAVDAVDVATKQGRL